MSQMLHFSAAAASPGNFLELDYPGEDDEDRSEGKVEIYIGHEIGINAKADTREQRDELRLFLPVDEIADAHGAENS